MTVGSLKASPKKVKQSGHKKPRVRDLPRHRSFKLTRKKYQQAEPVIGVDEIVRQTHKLIFRNKKIYLGLMAMHAAFVFVFILGLGTSFSLVDAKEAVEGAVGGTSSQASIGVALFSYLAGTVSAGATEGSGVYQGALVLIFSLAVIWASRQLLAGEKIGIRDPLYKGMYPLIPFLLVLTVIAVEFAPLAAGAFLYDTVIQNGLAVSTLEKVIWLILFILVSLLTLYMIISSVFALYIVTLPEVHPVQALRSARDLVLHRRKSITLRFLALPLLMLMVSMVIFVPIIIFAAMVAEVLFIVALSYAITFAHVYMYVLYRSLI
jgi:hypothetical protein